MNDLAPIVLFVYNRPEHTRKTLEALSDNYLADKSDLFVFCDGPKVGVAKKELAKLLEVRSIIKQKKWAKKVNVIERSINMGLSKSIITGINEVLKTANKVIVLEDDTLPLPGFLEFINKYLIEFANCNFAGVSGYSYENNNTPNEDLILTRTGSIWGWGTWKDSWHNVIFDADYLLNEIEKRNLINKFNLRTNYYEMLKRQKEGKIDSWGILYYASYFIENKYFILPSTDLIKNIGMDGSGIHYNKTRHLSNLLSGFIQHLKKK